MNRDDLKIRRREKRLSQWRLAKLSAVSRAKISNFENAYQKLSREEEQRISQALKAYRPIERHGS